MIKPYTIPKAYSSEQFAELIKIRPRKLLGSNGKLSKANIWQFTLPAAKASVVIDGQLQEKTICLGAKECLNFCFASSGSYIFRASLVAHTRNLQFVLDKPFDFVEAAIKEIKGKKNLHAIRLHDSGDWFSRAYFMVWKSIMEACPNVLFYCYTKALPLIKKLEAEGMLPSNFTVIYSEGGKFDHLIDKTKDRHSHVFSTEEDCLKAGYVLNEEDDKPATDRNIMKIGLVVHGAITYKKKMNKAVAEMNA
jgi:Gene product 88